MRRLHGTGGMAGARLAKAGEYPTMAWRCAILRIPGANRPKEVLAMGKPAQANREQMIRQLIAVRAYEIWESQGRPHGHHAAHWRQAEQDIMACLADSTSEAPVVAPKGGVPSRRSGKTR